MNSNKIETGAINCLKTILWNCPHIDPDISENDKRLSWDGFIFLFSDKDHKKENLVCKCEIQVKGKENLGRRRSFSISIADLINYQNNGGVLFFVVDIETNKVFYSELLPIKIGNILQDKAKRPKSISVELDEFPTNPMAIEILIKKFCEHSDKQRASKGRIIDFNEKAIELNGGSCFKGELNLIKEKNSIYLSDKSTYLYKQNKDGSILPLNLVKIAKITKTQKLDIYINDKLWKNISVQSVVTQKNEQPYLLINDNIYIYYNDAVKEPLKFILRGKISNLKVSGELMNLINQGCEVKLENWGIFKMCPDVEQKINFNGFYKELMAVVNVLEYLGVSDIVSYEQLTEDDINVLLWMSKRIADPKKAFKEDTIEAAIEPHQFSSFRVVTLFVKDSSQNIWILNPFGSPFGISKDNKNDSLIYPLFIFLGEEELEFASNLNYEIMLECITTYTFKVGCTEEIIGFILRALLVVDRTKNKCLLNVVTCLAKGLYEFEKTIINLINYLQCIRREREVTQEEADSLLNLFEENNDKSLMFESAIALILKDKYKYNRWYKQLDSKNKKAFDSYPIKYLENLL